MDLPHLHISNVELHIFTMWSFHIYTFDNLTSREKALLTLHVVTEMHFLLQKNLKNIMHGRVKMYVMR